MTPEDLHNMDQIIDMPSGTSLANIKVEIVQRIIKGLSHEIKIADANLERKQQMCDRHFYMYSHQCKETKRWIEKYQVIENYTLLDKVTFLFGKSID